MKFSDVPALDVVKTAKRWYLCGAAGKQWQQVAWKHTMLFLLVDNYPLMMPDTWKTAGRHHSISSQSEKWFQQKVYELTPTYINLKLSKQSSSLTTTHKPL